MSSPITVDASKFSDSLKRWAHASNTELPAAVKKQSAELVKTLVRLSFPASRTAAAQKIRAQIQRKFETLSGVDDSQHDGSGGVKWLFFNDKIALGVAPALDMRKADVTALEGVHYRSLGKKARADVPWLRYKNRRQKAKLIQRVVTTKAKVNALARRVADKLGRLKAGWLVGGVKLGVTGMAGWITRHISTKRGGFQDNLAHLEFPSFTVINGARGATSHNMTRKVQAALNIRAKAMLRDAHLYLKGVKRATGLS